MGFELKACDSITNLLSKSCSNSKLSFLATLFKNKFFLKLLWDSNPVSYDRQSIALTTTLHGTVYKGYNTVLRTVASMIENANKI